MGSLLKIGFLGGGKLGQAMAKGFISAGLTKPELIIASIHPSDKLSFEAIQKLGSKAVTENKQVVEKSDVIFVSVKPNTVPTVLKEIRPSSDGKLFISVAMGVNLKKIEKSLSSKSRVIRVMPNTCAFVQSACSVFARGTNATDADAATTVNLLNAIGTCEEAPESLFNVVTGLSGSGPAYVFVMIESLADGAVRMGMPRDMAYRLASQTVLGSGRLVRDSNIHPGRLKDDVTSPSGSTAAALRHLEISGFRAAVAGAVEAATIKCEETEAMQDKDEK